MLAFKQPESIEEFTQLPPMLKEVVFFLLEIWPDNYMEVTRIRDPRSIEDAQAAGESGIHCVMRAIDLRTNDLPEDKVRALDVAVNTKYIYDPLRPAMKVAYEHTVSGSSRHFHVQVSYSTIRRGLPVTA